MELHTRELITLSPGTIVAGRYQIIRCLGIGTMGVVYLSRPVAKPGPLCALKILSPANTNEALFENYLMRFRNEMLSAQRVQHPNVTKIFECIDEAEVTACAYEFVPGGDVAQFIRRRAGPLPAGETARMVCEMCAGVEAIHRAGIVHRDIKPGNILLTDFGQIKITDFGLAKSEGSPKLTARGGVAGTIQYLSPQSLEGAEASTLGDIYALGTVAYELATGVTPYAGASVFQLIELKVSSDPIPPRDLNPNCPPALSDAILKAVSRNPAERFQSAAEFSAALLPLASTATVNAESGNSAEKSGVAHSLTEVPSLSLQKRRGLTRIAVGGVAFGLFAMVLSSQAIARFESSTPQVIPAHDIGVTSVEAHSDGVAASDAGAPSDKSTEFVAQGSSISPVSGLGDYLPVLSSIDLRDTLDGVKPRSRMSDLKREIAKPIVRVSEPKPAEIAALNKPETKKQVVEAHPVAIISAKAELPRVRPVAPSVAPAPQEDRAQSAALVAPIEPSAEFKVRGTLLYRMADYVDWPTSAYASPDSALRLCILGTDPFGQHFERMLSRASSRSGRGFAVIRLGAGTRIDQMRGCQVLYINSDLNARAADILRPLRRAPILTVTDGSGDGIIDFVNQDRKVKFEISKSRAREAGITIGSLLLDLASRVTE